jgi:hypothetical protein
MDHLHHLIESNHFHPDAAKEIMEEISIPIQEGQSVTFYHVYQNYPWLPLTRRIPLRPVGD